MNLHPRSQKTPVETLPSQLGQQDIRLAGKNHLNSTPSLSHAQYRAANSPRREKVGHDDLHVLGASQIAPQRVLDWTSAPARATEQDLFVRCSESLFRFVIPQPLQAGVYKIRSLKHLLEGFPEFAG